jgi:hypothetical protein
MKNPWENIYSQGLAGSGQEEAAFKRQCMNAAGQNALTGAEEQPLKHVQLVRALSELNGAIDTLGELISDIRGANLETGQEVAPPMPFDSLEDVLANGGTYIKGIAEQLRQRVQHLREILF